MTENSTNRQKNKIPRKTKQNKNKQTNKKYNYVKKSTIFIAVCIINSVNVFYRRESVSQSKLHHRSANGEQTKAERLQSLVETKQDGATNPKRQAEAIKSKAGVQGQHNQAHGPGNRTWKQSKTGRSKKAWQQGEARQQGKVTWTKTKQKMQGNQSRQGCKPIQVKNLHGCKAKQKGWQQNEAAQNGNSGKAQQGTARQPDQAARTGIERDDCTLNNAHEFWNRLNSVKPLTNKHYSFAPTRHFATSQR